MFNIGDSATNYGESKLTKGNNLLHQHRDIYIYSCDFDRILLKSRRVQHAPTKDFDHQTIAF